MSVRHASETRDEADVVGRAWELVAEVVGLSFGEVGERIGARQSSGLPESLAPLIEQTVLAPTATEDQIRAASKEVLEFGFHGVCVNPRWVATAKSVLVGSDAAVVSVVGFPLGANKTDIKIREAREAVSDGATELDVVGDLGSLRSGNCRGFYDDLRAVIDASPDVAVKVILECGLLADDLERSLAASLAALAGAKFVKTSTGFAYDKSDGAPRALGATEGDVRLLAQSVGSLAGVKASGGIAEADAAWRLVEAGATRIGTSSGVKLILS